jgi:hypothetical protein
VASLYKGVVSAATGAGVIIGAYFAFYSTSKRFLREKTDWKDGEQRWCCCCCSMRELLLSVSERLCVLAWSRASCPANGLGVCIACFRAADGSC